MVINIFIGFIIIYAIYLITFKSYYIFGYIELYEVKKVKKATKYNEILKKCDLILIWHYFILVSLGICLLCTIFKVISLLIIMMCLINVIYVFTRYYINKNKLYNIVNDIKEQWNNEKKISKTHDDEVNVVNTFKIIKNDDLIISFHYICIFVFLIIFM